MAEQKTRSRRAKLKSLTDIRAQMSLLYSEARSKKLPQSELTALSQHLSRLHNMMISEKEIDISAELLELEQRLADIEEKR